jgi:hypothetical protein
MRNKHFDNSSENKARIAERLASTLHTAGVNSIFLSVSHILTSLDLSKRYPTAEQRILGVDHKVYELGGLGTRSASDLGEKGTDDLGKKKFTIENFLSRENYSRGPNTIDDIFSDREFLQAFLVELESKRIKVHIVDRHDSESIAELLDRGEIVNFETKSGIEELKFLSNETCDEKFYLFYNVALDEIFCNKSERVKMLILDTSLEEIAKAKYVLQTLEAFAKAASEGDSLIQSILKEEYMPIFLASDTIYISETLRKVLIKDANKILKTALVKIVLDSYSDLESELNESNLQEFLKKRDSKGDVIKFLFKRFKEDFVNKITIANNDEIARALESTKPTKYDLELGKWNSGLTAEKANELIYALQKSQNFSGQIIPQIISQREEVLSPPALEEEVLFPTALEEEVEEPEEEVEESEEEVEESEEEFEETDEEARKKLLKTKILTELKGLIGQSVGQLFHSTIKIDQFLDIKECLNEEECLDKDVLNLMEKLKEKITESSSNYSKSVAELHSLRAEGFGKKFLRVVKRSPSPYKEKKEKISTNLIDFARGIECALKIFEYGSKKNDLLGKYLSGFSELDELINEIFEGYKTILEPEFDLKNHPKDFSFCVKRLQTTHHFKEEYAKISPDPEYILEEYIKGNDSTIKQCLELLNIQMEGNEDLIRRALPEIDIDAIKLWFKELISDPINSEEKKPIRKAWGEEMEEEQPPTFTKSNTTVPISRSTTDLGQERF